MGPETLIAGIKYGILITRAFQGQVKEIFGAFRKAMEFRREQSMSILEELSALLQQGRAPKVKQLVAKALEEGIAPKDILEQGLLAGMGVIGDKFKLNQVFVPEVLIAARAMNAGLEVLKPALQTGDVEDKGTVVIGTVKGCLLYTSKAGRQASFRLRPPSILSMRACLRARSHLSLIHI